MENAVKRRSKFLPITALMLVTLLTCVTVNVYFPAAAIKDLSRKIEEEVQKEAAKDQKAPAESPKAPAESPKAPEPRPPEPPPPAQKPSEPPSAGVLDSLLGVSAAYAGTDAVGTPDVTSPAIRKIIQSRAARVDALNLFKSSGVVGENKQALVEIRNLEGISDLKVRAEVQRLVKAENADREELFREMAVAKKVDPSQIPKIRETYAATLRELARLGDWIQTPDGTWKKK